ncbi:putative WD repeat-containing protein C2A9.03-like isoform X2 [Senna tora]|uniref:Putative WD repeat-containing protein C2A9.03-like isoform X2 n=1 Tax=Senna tora TaxID=362788 RepID=A0A834U0P9_9FABA|nr:putative WD repeat-containing protein C2A9.03-like isoform X2 [Senna tora]
MMSSRLLEVLRNLVWAETKHDVYHLSDALVLLTPSTLNIWQPVSRVQISTMAVKENLMVACGTCTNVWLDTQLV